MMKTNLDDDFFKALDDNFDAVLQAATLYRLFDLAAPAPAEPGGVNQTGAMIVPPPVNDR